MTNRDFFRIQLLAGAATGAFLAFAAPVAAQEAPVETTQVSDEDEDEARLDTVTVKGIRGSIQNSLAAKRNASSIVEAISAEDIGKLPDLSIADSLARLPGVTAQRVRGRSQQISIRGLGPDFSLALLNGREVVSAGNNRGVEFDQFPSELIAQGIVYKTADATLAATGIAGAVDLRTVRPLDYTERKINLSAKYTVNDNDQLNPDFDDDGYRFFGSYIDQNEAGTVGWSIGATIQSNPTQFFSRELKTNRFQTSIDPDTGLVFPSDNPRFGVVSREFERLSVAGALQFEPNDRWSTTIDGFYTDTEDSGIFRGVETPIAAWANSSPQLTNITGTGGFADSATFDPVNPILRTDEEGNEAEIWAIGLNTSFDVTGRLKLTADISTSNLERNDIDFESYAGTGPAGTGVFDRLTFDFDEDGEFSVNHDLDYTDPNVVLLTDPGGWGQVGFLRRTDIEDELSQIRLEAEYELDLPFISAVVGGYLKTDREKTFDDNPFFLRESGAFVNGQAQIPDNSIVGTTNSGDLGFDIIAYDSARFLNDGTYFVQDCALVPGCVETEWIVDEDINTFFAMAEIDGAIAGLPLRGNFGFQYVDTTQSSTGTLSGSGEQTIEDDYSNFLPSLNLALEVLPDTLVRFAAGKTLTRPRLDQLAANQSFDRNNVVCPDGDADGTPDAVIGHNPPVSSCFSLNGGNPFLRPYESTAFDLSFEKYFGDASALSVAIFHKDLSDWVLDRTVVIDGTQFFETAGLSDFVNANPEVSQISLNGPVNFADGSIEGIELTARISLDDIFDLPTTLEGFGFGATYTYANNGLNDENGNEITIPGQSDEVWSTDMYYENHGFRAKLNARHRSGFLSEILQFDGTLSGAIAQSETVVDLQIGYDFETGPLEGFGLNFEVFNLTDEPFVTENETADPNVTFPSRHELYGTTFNFTVTKEF